MLIVIENVGDMYVSCDVGEHFLMDDKNVYIEER